MSLKDGAGDTELTGGEGEDNGTVDEDNGHRFSVSNGDIDLEVFAKGDGAAKRSPASTSPPIPTSDLMTTQSKDIAENNALSTPASTLGETNLADEFPVLTVCLIAGFSFLLIIFLLMAILATKYRRRISFLSKNNNTASNKNANTTVLQKASYRQKNKYKGVTFQEQSDTLQNRDYASLSNYSKVESGRPTSKSGPVYDQLEANEHISKSAPTYFVLEPVNQTQTSETDQKNVLHGEYDKLLRPQSPYSQGQDRNGSNHSDYHRTVVTRNDYDHIDRNLDVAPAARLNDNEYSTTMSKFIDSDRAYDHLDRSNNDGNRGKNVVSSAMYNDVVNSAPHNEVQPSTGDDKNGGSSHENEISQNSSPYEKTIIK